MKNAFIYCIIIKYKVIKGDDMKELFKKHAEKIKITALIMLFIILFIVSLIRFVPTFGFADPDSAEPIYKENLLYYNNLDRKAQFLYDALIDAIDTEAEYTKEIRYVFSSDEFNLVVQSIIADHPEYFYINFDKLESYVSKTHTLVKLAYYESSETIAEMKSALTGKVDQVLEALEGIQSDFEKELILHDYLVENCSYLTGAEGESYLSNTAYGALCEGQAYCDGYALAFKLLMNSADLYCSTVSGYANELPHMWNIVYINDNFYHVDVTWDDADMTGAQNMNFHGYFNLSADAISTSHTISAPEILPPAEDGTNYYKAIGHSASSKEELAVVLYNAMTGSAAEGKGYIEISLDYPEGEMDLRSVFTESVERVNAEGVYTFTDAYREQYCSDNKSFLNIEIYYEVN